MPAPRPTEFLCEEREALKTLVGILHDEQALLLGALVDDLVDVTSKKANIVSRLVQLANSRHDSLVADGLAADEGGMRAWLDKQQSSRSEQVWTETLSLVRTAKELNRLNGVLIGKRLSRSQHALSLLRAQFVPGMIYGADGHPKVGPTMRGLVVS